LEPESQSHIHWNDTASFGTGSATLLTIVVEPRHFYATAAGYLDFIFQIDA
jgi:hypothetical protein